MAKPLEPGMSGEINGLEAYRQSLLDRWRSPSTSGEERVALREESINLFARVAAPVNAELSALSLPGVGELCNSGLKYKEAIPILLKWLPVVETEDVAWAILDTLGVPWAKPAAAKPLIDFYRRTPAREGSDFKWYIGSALVETADDSVIDDIIEIVNDKEQGIARQRLAVALGNMKDPRAVDILIDLLNDDQMTAYAIQGLGKLAPIEARVHIEPFTKHKDTTIRSEAKKAIAKIDKKNPPVAGPNAEPALDHTVSNDKPIPVGLEETSTSIDLETLEPLLKELRRVVKSGFGKAEIDEVVSRSEALEHNEAISFEFSVAFDKERTTLRVTIIMESPEVPGIFVYSSPELIAKFNNRMHGLFERLDSNE